MGPPTREGIHRTMESALARKVEGLHALPEGVLLAERDRGGRWGEAGAYYAYCLRCGAWLGLDEARTHDRCRGRYWDNALADAAAEWAPEIEKMSQHIKRGEDPYFGLLDLRAAPAAPPRGGRAVGGLPALAAGRRQLICVRCPELEAPLEVVIDVPPLGDHGSAQATKSVRNGTEDAAVEGMAWADSKGPLKVLLYFHGHGEDCRQAPSHTPGCAVVAAQCPRCVGTQRCFWFQEGPGGAWERHEHGQLTRCEPMLAAAAHMTDVVLEALGAVGFPSGVEGRVRVMGVSMGGHAALEFSRAFPSRVSAAAIIAGYYEEAQIAELVRAIAAIPLLLVHRRGDRCCPFWMIERLHAARAFGQGSRAGRAKWQRCRGGWGQWSAWCEEPWAASRLAAWGEVAAAAPVASEAWFSAGWRHGPTDEERDEAARWLLQWP